MKMLTSDFFYLSASQNLLRLNLRQSHCERIAVCIGLWPRALNVHQRSLVFCISLSTELSVYFQRNEIGKLMTEIIALMIFASWLIKADVWSRRSILGTASFIASFSTVALAARKKLLPTASQLQPILAFRLHQNLLYDEIVPLWKGKEETFDKWQALCPRSRHVKQKLILHVNADLYSQTCAERLPNLM